MQWFCKHTHTLIHIPRISTFRYSTAHIFSLLSSLCEGNREIQQCFFFRLQSQRCRGRRSYEQVRTKCIRATSVFHKRSFRVMPAAPLVARWHLRLFIDQHYYVTRIHVYIKKKEKEGKRINYKKKKKWTPDTFNLYASCTPLPYTPVRRHQGCCYAYNVV